MRLSRRVGLVEGVVIGSAMANARRPTTVIVPGAYGAAGYYGQPIPGAYYPPGRMPTTEVVINTAAPVDPYQQQGVPYYPPGSQPQAYPQPMSPPAVSVNPTSYPDPGYQQAPQPTSYSQQIPVSQPGAYNSQPGAYNSQQGPYNSQPMPGPQPGAYNSQQSAYSQPIPVSQPGPYPQPGAPMNTSNYQDPAYNQTYNQGYNPPPYAMPPASSAPAVIPPAAAAVEKLPPEPVTAAAVVAGAEVAAMANAAAERRSFMIVNEANCSVLEVERGVIKPNTFLVADKRRQERPTYQIWYMDEGGVIRSKLNDFAIESKEHSERLRMMPYTGDARQKWVFDGNRIVNQVFRNDCLGLKKGLIRLKEDADVVSGSYEGKPYQHWRIEYI